MGTSILLIFIIPAMIFEVIFSFVSGAFVGYPTAKVELPYNEATGLVWEYDNVDDPYINLADTEIEDGKQIFYFECSGMNFEPNGEMMELVFTDQNGNEEVFYCVTSAKINAPSIYSEEECTLTEITLSLTCSCIKFKLTPNINANSCSGKGIFMEAFVSSCSRTVIDHYSS